MRNRLTTQEFIEKARSIHGDKYDYTKSVYKKYGTKITIICKKHDEFLQTPHHHLSGAGCRKCSHTTTVTTEKFIKRAKEIHGNKYNYSKSTYKNNATKLVIICQEHGEFLQTPSTHLSGSGCRKCYDEKQSLNIEKFVQKAKVVHGDKYDYSKVVYKKYGTKVTIICKHHGTFKQIPQNHLSGKGCPNCRNSKGESAIFETLTSLNVDFITEKRFKTCRDKLPLPFDFYIPSKNLLIEYNGKQHYFKVEMFNKSLSFHSRLLKDTIKRNWCKKNNIKLLVIPYTKFEEVNDIILKNVC